jgi:hypothetical protein
VTIVVRPQAPDSTIDDDAVERLTLRYSAAYAVYHYLTDKNSELWLSGGRPSKRARDEEEQAFEELDSARHALLGAAACAYPTIH